MEYVGENGLLLDIFLALVSLLAGASILLDAPG
jgi:hypothetical protein